MVRGGGAQSLVADYTFYSEVGGSVQGTTLDAMVQRFDVRAPRVLSAFFAGRDPPPGWGFVFQVAAQVFETTSFPVSTSIPIKVQVKGVTVYSTSGSDPLFSSSTHTAYLNAFSAIDWSASCLAHAFTNKGPGPPPPASVHGGSLSLLFFRGTRCRL